MSKIMLAFGGFKLPRLPRTQGIDRQSRVGRDTELHRPHDLVLEHISISTVKLALLEHDTDHDREQALSAFKVRMRA